MAKWYEANSNISPGLLIETLIICILVIAICCGSRAILGQARSSLLFPDTGIQAAWLNDNAYGNALENLAEIEPARLVSIISLTLLQVPDLGITSIHLDTTSKSVQGVYNREKYSEFFCVLWF